MGLFDFIKKKKNADNDINENIQENITENINNTDNDTNAEEEEFVSEPLTESNNYDNEVQKDNINEVFEDNTVCGKVIEEELVDTIISEKDNLEAEDINTESNDNIPEIETSLSETNEVQEEKTAEDIINKTEPDKKGFFAKIKAGLSKTRDNIMSGVDNVLKSFVKIDEELFEELEEALIMADIGVETSLYIIEELREKVKEEKVTEASEVKSILVKVISEILQKDEEPLKLPNPSVILVIGVNGVGKTTTIGKLAHNYIEEGKSVLLAAADTFRAAAIDQLQIWGERNNCDVIKHQENSDPAAVVFDAVNAAKARNTDILICDTAGRLHNKKNLMEELRKIAKVIEREYPQAHTEVFLVLDSTTGQNALQQAKLFKEVADITGLVLTKLDGTAKGGIVLAIKHDMNIPVRYIGIGEQINDLQPFDSKEFAKALFDME